MSREKCIKSIEQGRVLGDEVAGKIFNDEVEESFDGIAQVAYAIAILSRSLAVIDHLIGEPQVDVLIKALRDSAESAPGSETIQ